MQLKLAEYNIGQKLKLEYPNMINEGHLAHCGKHPCKICEDIGNIGKFERFLELGKDFVFGDNYIMPICEPNNSLKEFARKNPDYVYSIMAKMILRDEKDPLNRFGGLFSGRTYGGGRFVLIKENDDEMSFEDDLLVMEDDDEDRDLIFYYDKSCIEEYDFADYRVVGNLHQNPELYEKLN